MTQNIQSDTISQGPIETPKQSKLWIWLIPLIIGIMILICCACFALIFIGKAAKNSELTPEDSQKIVDSLDEVINDDKNKIDDLKIDDTDVTNDTTGLKSKETSEYVFYYPTNFKPTESTSPSIVEAYVSDTANSIGSYNKTYLNVANVDTSVLPDCTEYAETLKNAMGPSIGVSADNISTSYAGSIDSNGLKGCQLDYTVNDPKGDYYISRSIYTKSGINKAYVVTVDYDTENSEEYNNLKDAQSSFIIK